MSEYLPAINLICKFQGYNEKAYPDLETGGSPYSIGYGTQFYPDGSPVCAGQLCTEEKAMEYLINEVEAINADLDTINLRLDDSMRHALISFIHSVGWEAFLYSELVDCIGNENWNGVAIEFSRWIFDFNYRVIGNLVDRRREEIKLFLEDLEGNAWLSNEILLTAFRNYSAAPHQVRAIRKLEESLSPYVLAEFANDFDIADSPWIPHFEMDASDFLFELDPELDNEWT
jgi:GH24 family phage-related lysozyme (muramidase)